MCVGDSLQRFPEPSELLAAVMASCRDAIIACSSDRRICDWNRGAEEIYGYAAAEAIGEQLDSMTPADRRGELCRWTARLIAGEAVEPFETMRQRKDGEIFPATVCAFPVRDRERQVVGFATVERDATSRQHAAGALREALSAATEASAAKTRFLANVSHELRTPMNAFAGMTTLALQEDLSAEVRDYLETIRDSADAMLQLIGNILDLSRFESTSFRLEETAFDPRELVEGVAHVFGPSAYAKGLEIATHVSPETPAAAAGDPVRLRQVLANLVSNAVKFTSRGEVAIEVAPTCAEGRRCTLRFQVRDTGIGIAEADQSRIFAPFTQIDSATTRQYGGSGLGLTITRHLLTRFNSELSVESSPGKGSCFSFEASFLLLDAAAPARPAPARRSGVMALGAMAQSTAAAKVDDDVPPRLFDLPGPLKPLHILLAEDTPANRKVVRRVLDKRGHRLDVAVNGREALDAHQRTEYDVILMDVQMPIMDGLQAAEAIRQRERLADDGEYTPIVAMTAHSMPGDRERCLRAGMDAYLSKPLDLRELLKLVETIGSSDDGVTSRIRRRDLAATSPISSPHATLAQRTMSDSVPHGPDELDLSGALARLRGDESLLREMINFYQDDHRELLGTLQARLEADDMAGVERSAHSLKGLASTFDAKRTVDAAREVEEAAKQEGRQQLPKLVEALQREAAWLAEALQQRKSHLREDEGT